MPETGSRKIKPISFKEFRVYSNSTYRKLLTRGYHTLSKLSIEIDETDDSEIWKRKVLRKARLLRVFKKTKFVRNLDLSESRLWNKKLYFSGLLYIAKRISCLSVLSTLDFINPKTEYQGLFVSWPKYLKHLKSLNCAFSIENFNSWNSYHSRKMLADFTKYPKLTTYFLRYTKKLKNLEISGPSLGGSPLLDSLWNPHKYPASIEKISWFDICFFQEIPNVPLVHLKKLRSLEIKVSHHNAINIVIGLLSQAIQLETLTVDFVGQFTIDGSPLCPIIKKLVNLRKLKLKISLMYEMNNNVEILKSLEEISLRELHLDIVTEAKRDITHVINLLEKKKTLEVLNLVIQTEKISETNWAVQTLFKTIDDLPRLKSLYLMAKSNEHESHSTFFSRSFCKK